MDEIISGHIKMKKNIIYVHDFKLYINNGSLYTAVGLPERYFDRFIVSSPAKVVLFTRIEKSSDIPDGFTKIFNQDISALNENFSYFKLFNPFEIARVFAKFKESDSIVINYPSIIGLFSAIICNFLKKSYVLEIAADVDQFSTKKFGSVLTLIFSILSKNLIANATAAIYVSRFLSKKYPNDHYEVCSNVIIKKKEVLPKKIDSKNEFVLLFAGGMNKRKGISNILHALKMLNAISKFKFTLHMAGGHQDEDYACLAKKLGVEESVVFHGILNTESLEKLYCETDLYLQPSISEGIPRATLEAMSFGLPVVATTLPGFKEILNEECLIEPGKSESLAEKILEILQDPKKYEKLSIHNLEISNDFIIDKLDNKRINFYKRVLNNDSV